MAADPFKQLEVIRKASIKGQPITDCYRLMYKKELWVKAYLKLAPNPGNLTQGTSNQTIDGFHLKIIDDLIEELRQGKFRFSPVRRTYIPKTNGKLRPLGIAMPDSYYTSILMALGIHAVAIQWDRRCYVVVQRRIHNR